MRRWLALFLLILMPLQLSWGAVAPYCQHESSSAARHFGHHAHPHGDALKQLQGKKPAAAEKAKLGSLSPDPDCSYCHLNVVKPVATFVLPPVAQGAQTLSEDVEQIFSTRAPDHPERPNWRIA